MSDFDRAVGSLQNCRLIAPYQHDGVKWMLRREQCEPQGGILADEVGTGKTVQTIATMLGNPLPRTLMVMPLSVMPQWVMQFKRFAPSLEVFCFHGKERKDEVGFRSAQVVITTFGSLVPSSVPNAPMFRETWDRVVVDEAHHLKNKRSKRRTALASIFVQGPKWLLSATPIHNKITDYFSLQTYLDPEACRTVHQELTLRRTKQQIAQWVPRLALPKLVEEIVYVPMRPEEEANYLEVFEKCQKLARKEVSMARNNQLVLLSLLLRCVQACIHPKLAKPDKLSGGGSSKMDAVAACISANGNKTLVFCKFVKEIRWMEEILREKGVETYHLQGSLTPEERVAMINGFQTSDCRNATFLIQIDCGGCGLNLEQATDVYVMSPHWNPCVEEQCVGRAHRQGQTSRVRVLRWSPRFRGWKSTRSTTRSSRSRCKSWR